MKKLLTILALALTLCLLCSAALAADEAYAKASDYPVGAPITVKGTNYTVTANKILEPHSKELEYNTMRVEYTAEGDYKDFFVNLHDIKGAHTVTKAATCWEAGTYEVKCSVCGYVTKLTIPAGEKVVTNGAGEKVTAPNGHTHISKIKTEADCVNAGVSATYCLECKSFKPDSEVVTQPKTSHVFTRKVEIQAFTCMTKQAIWYEACKNCGQYKGEDQGLPRSLVTHYECTTLAAYKTLLGEKDYVPLTAYNPTSYDGHDWNAWSLETPATCARGNVYVRWCKNGCTTTQTDDKTDGTCKANPKNKTLDPVWIVDPKASLNCQSTTVNFVCELCGGSVAGHSKAGTVDATTGEVKDPNGKYVMVLPHEYVVSSKYLVTKADAEGAGLAKRDNTGKVAATCTVGAYREYKCIYEAEAGHKALGTYDLLVVPVADEPALGHNWGPWSVSTATDDDGNPYYWRQCLRCKRVEREFESVPTDLCGEHNFEVTTEATCTEAGEKTCSKCGTTEEVPALGHDYKVIVEVAPTCTKEGKGTKICNRCNDVVKDVVIEKLPHTPGEPEVTPATTEKEGSKVVKCTVCGEVLSTEVLPKELGETEFTAEVKFGEMTLTGKADQKEGTKEAKAVYARVTYFMADGTYVVVSVPVEADGTFESMNSGNVIHVSVQIVDSAKVRPGEFNRFGGAEFDVK